METQSVENFNLMDFPLKDLRIKLGYSQQYVAFITGISQATISRLEHSELKTNRERFLEAAIKREVIAYETAN